MSPLRCNALSVISALLMASALSGCTTETKPVEPAIPDYIGMQCDKTELSRIVTSKEMYAVCLEDQWVLVGADQFSRYRIILDKPLKRPELIMEKPASIIGIGAQKACIKVTEYEVGWADVDYQGAILRLPLVDGSCSLSPCGQSPEAYQASVCR